MSNPLWRITTNGGAPRNRDHRRLPAILGALAIGMATATAVISTAHAAPTTPPTPSTTAVTPAQASVQAHATGKPVTATAATNATDTLVANPDGTFTLNRAALPVRKLVNRAWTTLDATLHTSSDGSVRPTLTDHPIRFSGGGTGPLVSLSTPTGKTLALSVPMSLPTPALSGATATYTSVLPGVDLQVTADTQGGFRQILIVRDATAAANPAVRTLTLTATGTGVTVKTDTAGNLAAVDATGAVLFSAPAPTAWDSTPTAPATTVTDPSGVVRDPGTDRPVASGPAGPGEAAHTARMGVTVTGNTISLTPDATLLSAADTHFPVYLDPGWSSGQANKGWASVSQHYPSTNYWDNTPDPTANIAQVGNSGSMWSHTLVNIQVPLSNLSGATVTGATFTITETWSYSCTASTVNLYAPTTQLAQSNATWNYWAGVNLGSVVASQNVAHGYSSSCPAAGVGFNVKSAVTAAVSANRAVQTFVMTGVNESSDHNSWKEFLITTANLAITYDHAPSAPTGMTTSPTTACGATTPTTVGDGPVSLYAPVYDQDGESNLQATFTVTTSSGTSVPAGTVSASSGQTARLDIAKTSLETAAAGTTTQISWYVTVNDGTLTSAPSATCTFYFDPDTSLPQPPTVSGDQATMGTPVKITITKPGNGTAPASYLYQLNGAAPRQVTATNGSATVTVTPNRPSNVLTVTSLSATGAVSPTSANYTFTAAYPQNAQLDQDTTGDNIPDLHVVGGSTNNLPNGLWVAAGQPNSKNTAGTGQLNTNATDLGAGGDSSDTSPSDFTGNQVITGYYTGSGLQDVLAYNPTTGVPTVVPGNGDGSTLRAGDATKGYSGALGYDPTGMGLITDNPTQVAEVNNGTTFADLIAINGDTTNGYALNYDTNAAMPAVWNVNPLTTPTPDGDPAWNNWTITTCQLAAGNYAGTAMFLWKKSTGALYLWTGVTFGTDSQGNPILSYSSHRLAANGWNTNAAISLQAADIDGNNIPDLWSIGANAKVTTNLVTNLSDTTGTISAATPQTLTTATHAWKLDDNTGSSATDTIGTDNLTMNTGAVWNTSNPLYPRDVTLDGTSGYLSTTKTLISTTNDFTISIWVNPTTVGTTVLSEDTTAGPAFKLWSNAADNSWRFAMATSATSGTYDTATAPPGSAQLGAWTHLSVTYQHTTGQINLYVNTYRAAAATRSTVWATAGGLEFGAMLTATNTHGGFFKGQLANIQTFNQVLPAGTVWINLAAQYNLDEPSGATTLADSSGNGNTLTAANITLGVNSPGRILGGPTSGTFDGKDSTATSAGPVIDTTKSFTISAWAELVTTANWATIVVQKGTYTSPFDLQFDPGPKKWAWTVMSPDATAPTQTRIESTNPAKPNIWTHLTGVYDATAGQIRFYINGVLNATANTTITWNAPGSLIIGNDWWTKTACSWFPGSISNVQIFNTALDPATIATIASPTDIGHWPLGDGTGTTATDTSGYNRPATLSGGYTWTTGHTTASTALGLNGTDAAAQAAGPILDATQSLTITTWVNLNPNASKSWNSAVVEQGNNTSPFDLQYDPTNGKWAWTVMSPDATTPTQTRIWSTNTAALGTWTQLTGVYDAAAGQIRLYVNGTLQTTASATITWSPTTPRGQLIIGRDFWNATNCSWWQGSIQDVHTYTGAMTDAQVAAAYAASNS